MAKKTKAEKMAKADKKVGKVKKKATKTKKGLIPVANQLRDFFTSTKFVTKVEEEIARHVNLMQIDLQRTSIINLNSFDAAKEAVAILKQHGFTVYEVFGFTIENDCSEGYRFDTETMKVTGRLKTKTSKPDVDKNKFQTVHINFGF